MRGASRRPKDESRIVRRDLHGRGAHDGELRSCGGMGRSHAENVREVPGVCLRACADVREKTARKVQEDVGTDYFTTQWEHLLSDKARDGILIAMHHRLHRPMATLEASKPVFVEKPLALTEEDLQAIQEAVERTGIPLHVCYQARFSPFIEALKKAVPHPLVTIGQLIDPYWPEGHWANDPVEGGTIRLLACR